MTAAACAADALDELGIIPLVLHPIDIGGIDDQQRRGIVVIEEQRISIGETLQIGRFHQTLVGDAALLDALEQHPDRRLQIDHKIRLRRHHREVLINLLVQLQLIIIEGELREEAILLQQEVADQAAAEHIALPQMLQLLHALQQKRLLGRQRGLARVLIKALEKGIVLSTLQQQFTAEGRSEPTRKSGLVVAYRSLDDDVAGRVLIHTAACSAPSGDADYPRRECPARARSHATDTGQNRAAADRDAAPSTCRNCGSDYLTPIFRGPGCAAPTALRRPHGRGGPPAYAVPATIRGRRDVYPAPPQHSRNRAAQPTPTACCNKAMNTPRSTSRVSCPTRPRRCGPGPPDC